MAKIFLLEDNESLGKGLTEKLGAEGYEVVWAENIATAQKKFGEHNFDLAILDVSLPDGSGIAFAKQINSKGAPIVFLSAFSTAEYRLEGFDAGAVDYIPKPFHLRELLVRINRVLSTKKAEKLLSIGATTINFESMSVTDENGNTTYLASRDYELLRLLVNSSPKALTREEIGLKIWGEESSNTRTVDNAIVRLRQALGHDGAACIRAVRGVGYQWIVS